MLLLEKDLGERLLYCSMYYQLHSCSPWWDAVNFRHTGLIRISDIHSSCFVRYLSVSDVHIKTGSTAFIL